MKQVLNFHWQSYVNVLLFESHSDAGWFLSMGSMQWVGSIVGEFSLVRNGSSSDHFIWGYQRLFLTTEASIFHTPPNESVKTWVRSALLWSIIHYLDFFPSSILHETNSSHLEMDGWNTCFLLEWPYAVTSISSGLALCSPSAFPPVRHQKILDDEGIPPPGKVGKRSVQEMWIRNRIQKRNPCWGAALLGWIFFVERC